MPFKFNAKRIFLTYAQCSLTKEEVYERLSVLKPITRYIIARELHQGGNPHIHALIAFSDKVHTTNERYFDLSGYHPNIDKVANASSWRNHEKYCRKGGDFLTNMEEELGKRALLFKSMIEEGLTPDFVRRNPEIIQFNFSNLQNWLSFLSPKMPKLIRLPKKRHIWYSGPVNCGKTTFLRAYSELFDSVTIMPYNDDWSFLSYNCDLIIADEFKGQLPIQRLNAICDGGTHLNTKGGSRVLGQPVVFICSNFTIDTCYPNTESEIRDTLRSRFQEYPFPRRPRMPSREL